jgi:hypothetical protein
VLSVKFVDSALARVQSGSLKSEAEWNMKPVATLAQSYSAGFRQRLDANACTNLNAMIAMAEQKTGVMQPDFEGFHELVFTQSVDGTSFLAARNALLARPEVEYVGIGKVEMAPPPTVTPDYSSGPAPSQASYRGPNPGADFEFAHAEGLTGAGMRLSEVSPTYDPLHEEFINNQFDHDQPEPPESFAGTAAWDIWVNHGTATLGQNLAPDNGFGVTGMTHDASGYIYQTGERSGTTVAWRFEDAYCNALSDSALAGNGQIVYWEHQSPTRSTTTSGGPVELDALLHSLTKTGTDAGVVVLMPAGNCNRNLDSGDFAEWRGWGDSGAIIVGAGSATPQHERLFWFPPWPQFCGGTGTQASSYGQRVGPQGWGEGVVVSGFGDLIEVDGDIHRRYTATFAGTSSATPMVAGAALLVQQHAIASQLTPLSSREMRSFLQQTGIPQGGTTTGNIGAFIDLEAAITRIADSDLSIVTTSSGTLITTTVTNNGPRTADEVEVTVMYHNPSVHWLVADDVPSTCAFSSQVPIPEGAQCPGQCPSLLECDFTDLAVGESKIIRFDVTGSTHGMSFSIESDVSLKSTSELQDPELDDNDETISVPVSSPTS